MKKLFFMLIICYAVDASSQPNWNWANSYGTIATHEYTNAMCTDSNGNSYLTGTFQTSIIFGNDTLSSPGGGMFFTKFDSSGNPLWAKMPGGNNSYEVNAMILDDSGNIYMAGALAGEVIFENDTVTNTANHKNLFIGKFDSDLNLIWAQQADGFVDNMAFAVAVNHNSEVYITGIYDTSITIGTTFLQGGNNTDNIFVAKYDINGNNLWAITSVNNTNPVISGMVCDNFDHVCITGHFNDSLSFGSVTIFSSNQSVYLMQFDAAGNALWGSKSGGFPSTGYSKCISSDSAGNYYCCGFFNSPVMIFGTDTLVNAGFNDLFLAKYDNLGNLIWAKSAGGPDYDEATAIKTDEAGNTYMTGFFKGNISFGTTFLFGPFQELYVAKYDSDGNPLWATSATGTINERGFGIGLDRFNNLYVNGDFTSPTTTFGQHTITNTDIFTGSYDIFFARLGDINTGINDFKYSEKENLLLYPNPSNGFCRIMNKYDAKSILRIFDMQGRTVNEITLNNDNVVDLKNISPGMYLMQLSSREGVRNGKLVVQ